MIDALFGSKTRVKLLHLFLNNSGKSFYVRELTRLIDEQINSVRRELANLLDVGVITSHTADNKLFYEVNQQYEFYQAFRSIFADSKTEKTSKSPSKKQSVESIIPQQQWRQELLNLGNARVVVLAGVLVKGSVSSIDLMVAGSISEAKLKKIVSQIEADQSRSINYSVLSYDEFYYRLSVRDRFIMQLLSGRSEVLLDEDNIISV